MEQPQKCNLIQTQTGTQLVINYLEFPETLRQLFDAVNDKNFNPIIQTSNDQLAYELINQLLSELEDPDGPMPEIKALDPGQVLVLVEIFNYLIYNQSFPELLRTYFRIEYTPEEFLDLTQELEKYQLLIEVKLNLTEIPDQIDTQTMKPQQ